MDSSLVTSELVLLLNEKGVSRVMQYQDFEAIVDGMVAFAELANKKQRFAYAVINSQLRAKALVLFYLDFDEDGQADHTWNIPLRHLAQHALPGPDMGAGAIRLACRSQCPVAWHKEQLWDPIMKPNANDFVFIRDALLRSGAKLGVARNRGSSEAELPVLDAIAQEPASAASQAASAVSAQLAEELDEWKMQVGMMEKSHEEEIAQLRYAQQQKEEILSSQLEKVLMQFKALKSQNTALKDQADSLRAQVESLNASLEEQMHRSSEHGSELEILTEQYRIALEQRIEEERSHLSEQLHGKEVENLRLQESVENLQKQIEEQKLLHAKTENATTEKLFGQLQKLGVNFVAFHPGAGHISIKADDLIAYTQNPIAFAARKCLVTEDHYKAWLKHYEQPVCQVQVNGNACGKRVVRVDVPSQFKPGESDCNTNLCQHCISDKAIENVLKFR